MTGFLIYFARARECTWISCLEQAATLSSLAGTEHILRKRGSTHSTAVKVPWCKVVKLQLQGRQSIKVPNWTRACIGFFVHNVGRRQQGPSNLLRREYKFESLCNTKLYSSLWPYANTRSPYADITACWNRFVTIVSLLSHKTYHVGTKRTYEATDIDRELCESPE